MALVGGAGLAAVEAEGIGRVGAVGGVGLVGVAGQQAGMGQRIDVGRRVGGGVKRRLAGRIGRVRIGREIVVEGDVLLEDDDQVLDRRGGRNRGGAGGLRGEGEGDRADAGQRGMSEMSNSSRGFPAWCCVARGLASGAACQRGEGSMTVPLFVVCVVAPRRDGLFVWLVEIGLDIEDGGLERRQVVA